MAKLLIYLPQIPEVNFVTSIPPRQFKLRPCEQSSRIKLFLLACMVASANPTLAQAPAALVTTRQDQLFKEAYRLPIPQDVLTYPWMSAIVDYDSDGSLDVI